MAVTVTVFGGTGYLGRAVVEQLLTDGAIVRVAARHPEHIVVDGPRERLQLHVADVRDAEAVAQALNGAQSAVNAVGLYVENAQDSFESVHVAGARTIAEQAAKAGLRTLIHVSGIGASADSASSYVRARAEGECAAADAFEGTVVVRPSVLFGPGDAFLNSIDSITRISPVFPLFGTGETRLQPVFVNDVADGISALAQAAPAGERHFEFGGPDVLSYREVVERVLRYRRRRRLLIPFPFVGWMLQAHVLSLLPNPPLTTDQVILMRDHNVVGKGVASLPVLGITPRGLEALLPQCLDARLPQ